MDARLIERIETTVDRAASALLAAAVGYAIYVSLGSAFSQVQRTACAAIAATFACLLCHRALRFVATHRARRPVVVFDVRKIESEIEELLLTHRVAPDELLLTDAVSEELVLTDADRLETPRQPLVEPLVLDDILAEMGPDARVVRLFDPKAMPSPGQLRSRIDNHLEKTPPTAGASDASQALADALAELRRSLR
jgi:hypothetical protein